MTKTIKLSNALIALITVAFLASAGLVYARTSLTDEEIVKNVEAEENKLVHYQLDLLTSGTSTVLVDLSDTTNYPHFVNDGNIQISRVAITSHSTSTASTSTVQLGVIGTTNAATSSDIYWFEEVTLVLTGAGASTEVLDYSPSVAQLDVDSGEPIHFVTNSKSLANTTFQTDVALNNAVGTTTSGTGDFVATIAQDGQSDVGITVFYRVTEN